MPNWKKVIVSGSNAILNNITASGDISASGDIYATNFYGNFEGTASLATLAINANTASLADKVEINDYISGGSVDILLGNQPTNTLYIQPDSGLTYNFDNDTLSAQNFSGTASLATTSSYSNTISINNDANNRIITSNGDNTLNAEQNLSFNGSKLELTGSLHISSNNPVNIRSQVGLAFDISDNLNANIIRLGDPSLSDNETVFTVDDYNENIKLTFGEGFDTIFSQTGLDLHGNITASGNVSASSFIGNLTGTSTLASNLTGTPSIVVNNITASGDISSSGDLYSTHVFIPQGITTADAGLIFGDTIAGNSGYIADNDGVLVIGYNDSDKLSISDTNEALLLGGNTRITGHITASKNVNINGDLIVGGNITANQYIVSSSVTYMTQSFSSGSTIFGDTQDDTHQFTGSVDITGSLSIPGFVDVSASLASKGNVNTTGTPSDNQIAVFTNSNTIEGSSIFTYDGAQLLAEGGAIFNTANDDQAFQIKGSSDDNLLQVNPQSGDKVGIGTATPSEKLTVEGNISASGITTTGYLTASGINYPIADGELGDVFTTDGLGNISIDKPRIYIQVKSKWPSTLSKGTPVYVSESVGNLALVKPASASDASTMPAIGVLGSDFNFDDEGVAIVTGFINGVNTSQFNEGDVVYVGADGLYTNIKPTGSNLIQNLGIVEKVDETNGSGFVYGSGRANDVPNIPAGYAWVGNSDGVATAVPTSSFAGVGDNLGNHIATQDLDMAGFNISASLNITASGNISASGYVSADHLILNPNTTTTGSNDTETQIDISLGDEEYKRGVIKRVFDFRENLASADDVNINNQVIADIGEFKKGTLDVTIELNGYRPDSESFNTDTASLNQNIKIHTVPTTTFQGSAVDVLLEEGAAFAPFVSLLDISTTIGTFPNQFILYNSLLKIDNEQIKFNVSNINNANILLSSSLAIIYIDYQLYK